MKFIDTATIKLRAGKGGNGCVAFRRELYVPLGGPSGGDGGDGGDIIFIGNNQMTTLLDLKFLQEIKAPNGEPGGGKNMHGKCAEDKYVPVPLGTLIFNKQTNKLICDIVKNKQECIVAKGGKGGRGNARFASKEVKAPRKYEKGELGEIIDVRCELKILADVGLVGLPNAGKSTLLSKISRAKPEIADYPFTTLNPQLGVAQDRNGHSFVVADLPGLIEGASLGKGLGHAFLRHIERCKIIVHVLDMSGNLGEQDVGDNYIKIKNELKTYKYRLELREEIVVANKMDLEISNENLVKFKTRFPNLNIVATSGLLGKNVDELLDKIGASLTKLKEAEEAEKEEKAKKRNDKEY